MEKVNLDKKQLETKGIHSAIILEIIGKPAEHLVSTLEDLIKKIDEEKGVRVISKKINEPVLMKDSKEYYTTFAEVELEVEDILYLAIIMFKYMPAHVEVISPELIALTNNGWTDILSELTRRLHGYDEIARIIQIQNAKMKKQVQDLMKNKETKEEIKKDDTPKGEIKKKRKKK